LNSALRAASFVRKPVIILNLETMLVLIYQPRKVWVHLQLQS